MKSEGMKKSFRIKYSGDMSVRQSEKGENTSMHSARKARDESLTDPYLFPKRSSDNARSSHDFGKRAEESRGMLEICSIDPASLTTNAKSILRHANKQHLKAVSALESI